jgi:hypothetical protein
MRIRGPTAICPQGVGGLSGGARQRSPLTALVEEGLDDVADQDQRLSGEDQHACDVGHGSLQEASL